jgi:hypothetical protein
MVIAFWSCLQLESDILAEIPLPFSGILSHEEGMPYPDMTAASEFDGLHPRVCESYIAQLSLRRHLNKLHGYYKPGLKNGMSNGYSYMQWNR